MHSTVAIILGITLVSSSVYPGDTGAQTISSPYRFVERKQDLGLYVSWLATGRGNVDLGPNSGPVYGLQYAMRLSDPMQLGALGGYFTGDRDVIDPAAEGGATAIGTADQDLVLIAGRLQFNITGARTWHNLIPYLIGGVGIVIDATSEPRCVAERENPQCQLRPDQRFEFGNSFMGQFGVGLIWLPGNRFGFRATVHDNIWQVQTPDGFLDPELDLDPAPPGDSQWTNNFQFSLGLSFWF